MRAVALLLRTQLRQHWASWLALACLVALAGGAVIAAGSTARRTAAAVPGFTARHGYDAIVYSARELPELARFSMVASVTPVPGPLNFDPVCKPCTRPLRSDNFDVFEVPPRALPRTVRLLSGRMPDQSRARETLASYTLARDYGVRPGSVISILVPTKAQLRLGPRKVDPAAISRRFLTVTGIVVTETEFPSGLGDRYDIFPTRAFAVAVNPRSQVLQTYYVRLRHGAADLPAFDSQLRPLRSLGEDDLDTDAAAVQRSIGPQVAGWWALAGLAAIAGLAVIGQAASRQFVTDAADQQALAALGLRRTQFAAVGLIRAAAIGLAGAAGAAGLAALLSPLTPVGEARLAADSAGSVTLDVTVAVAGAAGAALAAVALSVWPALRIARLTGGRPVTRPRPAAVVRAATWAGASPAAVLGTRYALERGRGRQAVPVATALLGSVLGLAALCGTAVFGASLARLIATPALYGAPYSVEFSYQGIGNDAVVTSALLPALRRDPVISQVTVATVVEVTVNGEHVRALVVNAVRGRPLLSVIDGAPPRGDGQIMLGAATMRALRAGTGGRVEVTAPGSGTGPGRVASFVVTGRASFSPQYGTGGLGNGAILTFSGLARAQCGPPPGHAGCVRRARSGTIYAVLVRPAAGRAGAAALARYKTRFRSLVTAAATPTDLTNFGESVNFPLLFSALLSLFAAATMLHLLLVSVARRRTEAGLLKVLGFVRWQIAAVVGWQATAVALAGIAAGVPLGIAAGKAAWRLFATSFGVVPVAVVPGWTLVLLVAAVLIAANLLAVLPALIAARSRPARLLRAE